MKRDRKWLKDHRLRRARKRAHHCARDLNEARAERDRARQTFEAIQARLPKPNVVDLSSQGWVVLDPPVNFNFDADYAATLAFLMEFQMLNSHSRTFYSSGGPSPRGTRFRHYAALELLETLSPAAALVLVAEARRWMRSSPRTSDDSWAENVRDFFHDFGLFEVLGVRPQTVRQSEGGESAQKALKFRVGKLAEGETADQLRAELEALCGENIGPRRAIYKALTEAMTNTRQHAYPNGMVGFPKRPPAKWWAGGSWSPDHNRVHVMIYDQGVGIPATLPRSKIWRQALDLLRGREEISDAGLIDAAMELRRTQTAEPGRGKGFKDMTDWIDATGSGFFRVLSGRGQVTYKAGGKVEKRTLPAPFLGTLVEWEISLNG